MPLVQGNVKIMVDGHHMYNKYVLARYQVKKSCSGSLIVRAMSAYTREVRIVRNTELVKYRVKHLLAL